MKTTISLCLIAACVSAPVFAAKDADLFDKPSKVVRRPLPKDPLNPQAKTELSCLYFKGMMIKQVDMGEVGAESLTVTNYPVRAKVPSCVRQRGQGEITIGGADPWSGYFYAVKGSYLFFSGEDGYNGGDLIGIFDNHGNKIYDDLTGKLHAVDLLPANHDTAHPVQGTVLRVRYERVYPATCSLRADPKGCWQTIRQATGLTAATPPDCSKAYAAEAKRLPTQPPEQVTSIPSVIQYTAEVTLDGKGAVSPVIPLSQASACWLQD